MYITKINMKGNVNARHKATKICRDIAEKDYTFEFKFDQRYLYIKSPSKDIAIRRGLLFVKKYLSGFDLGFESFWASSW